MFSNMSSLLHSWNNPFINSSRQNLPRLVKEIWVKFTLGMLVIVWHTTVKEN